MLCEALICSDLGTGFSGEFAANSSAALDCPWGQDVGRRLQTGAWWTGQTVLGHVSKSHHPSDQVSSCMGSSAPGPSSQVIAGWLLPGYPLPAWSLGLLCQLHLGGNLVSNPECLKASQAHLNSLPLALSGANPQCSPTPHFPITTLPLPRQHFNSALASLGVPGDYARFKGPNSTPPHHIYFPVPWDQVETDLLYNFDMNYMLKWYYFRCVRLQEILKSMSQIITELDA